MNEQILATLGAGASRLILIEPPSTLVPLVLARPETSLVVATSARRARLLRLQRSAAGVVRPGAAAPLVTVACDVEALPCASGSADVVVLASGLTTRGDPLTTLGALRRVVRPGGAVVVVSRVRAGAIGVAGSALSHAARRGKLPEDSDLSAWMLFAGMREVRQAAVPSAVVPTVVTWASVRRRPWEDSAELSAARR